MALLNSLPVTNRWDRPSPTDDVFLELYYIKGGMLKDPVAVSSVHIFPDTDRGDASVWLDTSATSKRLGLVATKYQTSANFVFNNINFSKDPNETDPDKPIFPPVATHMTNPASAPFSEVNFTRGANAAGNSYENDNSASAIFRIGQGHYAVVLRDTAGYVNYERPITRYGTGTFPNFPTQDNYIVSSTNTASGTLPYFDIWTIQTDSNSKPRTLIHQFDLYVDDIISTTEPFMVETTHRMMNKYINRGSLTTLKITTDYVVINRNIDQSIKNIFKDGVLDNAAIRIVKLNDDSSQGLPFTLVKDWDDTRFSIGTDSADTITYNWDTDPLPVGTYQVQASSMVFDNKVISDKFNVILR